MLKKICLSLVVTPLMMLAMGCETEKSARIMEDDEADMVDVEGVGAAGFERLVKQSVTKLLDRNRGDENAIPIRRLAFVDLQNRTKEELGEWREQLIDQIVVGVDKHPAFRIIADQMVSAVLREMGSPPVDQLFLPKGRRQFAKILEREKSPVQYLMYGRLTRGGTLGDAGRQANYQLTLELIDVVTGEADTVGTVVRKAYAR